MIPFSFIGSLGPMELAMILVIGLLVFGRRLPEVGRSVGKTILELKRGLRQVEDEVRAVDRLTDEIAAQPIDPVPEEDRAEQEAPSDPGSPAPEDGAGPKDAEVISERDST